MDLGLQYTGVPVDAQVEPGFLLFKIVIYIILFVDFSFLSQLYVNAQSISQRNQWSTFDVKFLCISQPGY